VLAATAPVIVILLSTTVYALIYSVKVPEIPDGLVYNLKLFKA
jgi:hypothetical protein